EALVVGRDLRNWYRADRFGVRADRVWEGARGELRPSLEARTERAWSVRPGVAVTSQPWSLFDRGETDAMMRQNPAILPGRISSVLGGAAMAWDDSAQGTRTRLRMDVEVPFDAPGDARFVQSTLHGEVAFPTFGTQRFRTEVHWVFTAGDTPPPQRWA